MQGSELLGKYCRSTQACSRVGPLVELGGTHDISTRARIGQTLGAKARGSKLKEEQREVEVGSVRGEKEKK